MAAFRFWHVSTGRGPWNLLGFNHFARAQAGRAHADPLRRRPHLSVHRTQVDVPAPFAHVVGMADGVPELRPLAADITDSCHKLLTLRRLDAETLILQTRSRSAKHTAAVVDARIEDSYQVIALAMTYRAPFRLPLKGLVFGQLRQPCP